MQINLTGKITQIESGSEYTDDKPRIHIKISGAQSWGNTIIIPVDSLSGYELDKECNITINFEGE